MRSVALLKETNLNGLKILQKVECDEVALATAEGCFVSLRECKNEMLIFFLFLSRP
jgi:hypothetical protein